MFLQQRAQKYKRALSSALESLKQIPGVHAALSAREKELQALTLAGTDIRKTYDWFAHSAAQARQHDDSVDAKKARLAQIAVQIQQL